MSGGTIKCVATTDLERSKLPLQTEVPILEPTMSLDIALERQPP